MHHDDLRPTGIPTPAVDQPSQAEEPGALAAEPEGAAVASPDSSDSASDDSADLEGRVVEALQTIFDPEIPVNIYELGLIYSVAPDQQGHVDVKMTLTSPHCPVAESLPGEVRRTVESVGGVSSAQVDVVWDPPWNPDMMSEAAKLELGMF